ncbi:peptidylprolyl isomerase [Pedobacter nyackensis]|uniref:peptidylprolyl isomerase n=1 Tax=Pedobacter nyackensis TaxID=475255 RepID=A0A1W2ENI7_9SPHI|nr:peptidylprolyl isomerase [Pedobacter nyackensis]SMD11280.1 peptidyl-prolyl cis-trans isomerase B (cyclophilin B) [Pedobacter nyackensis]
MKRIIFSLFLVLLVTQVKAQSTFVRFMTNKDDITIMLYDETPKHRDMFLTGIKKGWYKNAEFNRVIKSFVSQGGELDDTILNREKRHPELGAKRFAAEIKPNLFHKKGALGAGRDDNAEKASYFTQIYLVVGKKQTDAQLDAIEQKKNRKIPAAQRAIYKTAGGTPHLDQDYTIFGEIVEGMEVADAINAMATDKNDVPLSAVVFNPVILSKKQATKFQQQLKKKKIYTHE